VKVDELRELEEDQLGDRLRGARRELYELRFKHAVGQLENSSQIAKVRHDIARIMTVITERELGLTSVPVHDTAPVAVAEKDEGFEPDDASPPSAGVPAPQAREGSIAPGGEVQQSKAVEAPDAPKPKRVRKAKEEKP
jgi:large subunit ribosomal protein L29